MDSLHLPPIKLTNETKTKPYILKLNDSIYYNYCHLICYPFILYPKLKKNMNNSQGKRPEQVEYSYIVSFFSFIGILMVFIWTSCTVFWAIMATWGVFVILALMFLNGAGTLNKRYDDAVNKEFEKAHEEYVKEQIGIDTGIIDNESEINNEGKLIYF